LLRLKSHLNHTQDSNILANETKILRNSLKDFCIINWNLAGLRQDEVAQLYIDITLETHWSVMFIQEFSCHTEATTIDTCNSVTYVFPCISSSSRSNAISVTHALNKYVVFSEFGLVGGLIGVKLGNILFVLITTHIPHRGHNSFTLEQSIEEVDRIISLAHKHAKILHVKPSNVKFLGGGDFNTNLEDTSTVTRNQNFDYVKTLDLSPRRSDILAWISSHSLHVAKPDSPSVYSHVSWSTGAKRLIDYFFRQPRPGQQHV
jgi:hypothetical protein